MSFVTGQTFSGQQATDSIAPYTLSFSATGVTAGNALLVVTRTSTSNVSGVSSNVDGALTQVSVRDHGSVESSVWLLENASAGSHTLTVTSVAAATTVRYVAAEYDNVPASVVVDDSDSATFTSTASPATNSITTTGTNRVVVSVCVTDSGATSFAPATGETERIEYDTRIQLQDEAAAAAGDYSASWTLGTAQTGAWHILALKSSAAAIKYLKTLTHSIAAGISSVAGTVFNEPTGGDICGTKIGEFTNMSFLGANSLDGGKAKLLVNVSSFGGSALTTADAPVVYVRTSSFDTGIVPATVVEI